MRRMRDNRRVRRNPSEFITKNSYKPREHGQCQSPNDGGYFECGPHPWYGFDTCCVGSMCVHCVDDRTSAYQPKRQGGTIKPGISPAPVDGITYNYPAGSFLISFPFRAYPEEDFGSHISNSDPSDGVGWPLEEGVWSVEEFVSMLAPGGQIKKITGVHPIQNQGVATQKVNGVWVGSLTHIYPQMAYWVEFDSPINQRVNAPYGMISRDYKMVTHAGPNYRAYPFPDKPEYRDIEPSDTSVVSNTIAGGNITRELIGTGAASNYANITVTDPVTEEITQGWTWVGSFRFNPGQGFILQTSEGMNHYWQEGCGNNWQHMDLNCPSLFGGGFVSSPDRSNNKPPSVRSNIPPSIRPNKTTKPHQKINTGINPYIPDVGNPNLNSRTNGSCPDGWVECPPMNHSDGCNLCHCNTGIQGWWPTCLEPPATAWDCNRWDTQGRWPIQFCNHECGDCSQVCAGWNAEHYYNNWHLYGGGECTTNWNACAYPPDSANWGGSCDSCEHQPNIPGGPDCNDGWCSAACECPVHPEWGSFGTYPNCELPTPNCCNGGVQCTGQLSKCCNEMGLHQVGSGYQTCTDPYGGPVNSCECFNPERMIGYQAKTHRKGGQICPDGSTRVDAFGNNIC